VRVESARKQGDEANRVLEEIFILKLEIKEVFSAFVDGREGFRYDEMRKGG
jgi:hypothetical protein